MVSEEVKRFVCEREGILNPCGYHPHHCFFHSEYFKPDRDEAWNIEPITVGLHDGIHGSGLKKYKQWEVKLKRKALGRYAGPHRKELEGILNQKSDGVPKRVSPFF